LPMCSHRSFIIFRLWSHQMYNFNVNFMFVIQQYAYLMAIKDWIFGTTASCPQATTKVMSKTRRKRLGTTSILCGVWMGGSAAALVIGITLQILEGYMWYNFLPLILLDSFNLFITHWFIFYSTWKNDGLLTLQGLIIRWLFNITIPSFPSPSFSFRIFMTYCRVIGPLSLFKITTPSFSSCWFLLEYLRHSFYNQTSVSSRQPTRTRSLFLTTII